MVMMIKKTMIMRAILLIMYINDFIGYAPFV